MGFMDDMKDKAERAMNDPAKRQKIEQIAKDKGISMDEAKEHFLKHNDQ